ncbi:MAG: hypothetical protein HY914_05580 [Desulfomonile tiedjei]|nr:hypothetical protein [Desulfomonile tiedjei]
MASLAEAQRTASPETHVQVLYHRYLGNLDDEVLMRQYARDLGFTFQWAWAYLMPLEKYLETGIAKSDTGQITMTEADAEIMERFALPIREAVDICRRYKHLPCQLRDTQITLDPLGNTIHCCTVYEAGKFTLGSFLSSSISELQKLKHTQDICTTCMENGLHVLFVYGTPELDDLGFRNIVRHYKNAGIDFLEAVSAGPFMRGQTRARAIVVNYLRRMPWLYRLAKRIRHRVFPERAP